VNISVFRGHDDSDDKLHCPYDGCGKKFDKPTVLTDASTVPRSSFYACPHCMSRLDIKMEGMKIKEIKPVDYPKVFDSPAKCAHFFGFLHAFPSDVSLPDDCLTCPKVLQCNVRR
jgi:DNA-directed RNA polymerase subunit RPC12/RpoP